MNSRITQKAFTLVELLVGITIIGILLLSASKINFNRLSVKQELDIFTNSVKSNFENIRNNSLSGKGIGIGVGNDLLIPEKRKIEYSGYDNGIIVNSTFSGSVRNPLNIAPKLKTGYSISRIRCLQLDGTQDYIIPAGTGTGEIEFIGSNIYLKGDCSTSTSKILELTIKNRNEIKIISINTLNGLVEAK